MRGRVTLLLAGLVFLTVASCARAALTLALSPASQAAAPGADLVFGGLLTNTSATAKVYLNDLQAALTGDSAANLALETNTFFANVPGILLPGETYNGPLFRVKLSASAAAAVYGGTITFSGGSTITDTTSLASSSFSLLATPVDQWRYNTFGSSANDAAASDSGDWDHDRTPNLVEYALGLNPKVMDETSLPKPIAIDGYLTLSYTPVATDVTYAVQSSIDLVNWSSTNVEPVTVNAPAAPVVTWRYKIPMSSAGRVFLRLQVSR